MKSILLELLVVFVCILITAAAMFFRIGSTKYKRPTLLFPIAIAVMTLAIFVIWYQGANYLHALHALR